jgi:branched-chain amino acid transport system ATP-binding protein
MTALLEIEHLDAYYGWIQSLHSVSLAVEMGGITLILGANGAGKTTTLRAISGMIKTSGVIRFAGR